MVDRKVTITDLVRDDALLRAARAIIDAEADRYDLGDGRELYKKRDGFYIRKKVE
ncbi:MAG: hypothetical protein QXU82_03575 [Candidatus Aenigmatarchaeota archaeon]